MSDDPPMNHIPAQTGGGSGDWFALWFFRVVQLVGLGGFIHELVRGMARDRPWILLTCLAMMIGAAGINIVLKWALSKAS